jgi:hypothetical protein
MTTPTFPPHDMNWGVPTYLQINRTKISVININVL